MSSKSNASSTPLLRPGGLVTEGTAGSTGVSLAMLSPSFGVRAAVWMPDDAAEEKSAMVREVGRSFFFGFTFMSKIFCKGLSFFQQKKKTNPLFVNSTTPNS